MNEDVLSNQEAAIGLLSKFLVGGYFPEEAITYIAENSLASAELQDFQHAHPQVFDKLVNHIELLPEEKDIASDFVSTLISRFKSVTQLPKKSNTGITEAFSSINEKKESVRVKTEKDSRMFSEALVGAWKTNLKNNSAKESIEKRENDFVGYSKEAATPKFAQQTKGSLHLAVQAYTDRFLETIQEEERETVRQELETITTEVVTSQAADNYETSLRETRALQETTDVVVLKATEQASYGEYDTKTSETPVDLKILSNSYFLLASNSQGDGLQESLIEEAVKAARVASVLNEEDTPEGLLQGGVSIAIGGLTNPTPQQQATIVEEHLLQQTMGLVYDKKALTQLGLDKSPLISSLQIGPVPPSQDTKLPPSFIYGLQVSNKKNLPWAKTLSNPLTTEGAVFGMWLSLAPDDTLVSLSSQMKTPNKQSPLFLLSEQIKSSSEAMEIYTTIYTTRLIKKEKMYSPSQVFKLYLARLYGASSEFSFIQKTGLMFKGKGFGLASIFKGSTSLGRTTLNVATKGAVSGTLSKGMIAIKGLTPVGWAVMAFQLGVGVINKFFSAVGLPKIKISPEMIGVYVALAIVAVVAVVVFGSHADITNKQIAQNIGGGPQGGPVIVCAADDPSCQPCDPTTGDCRWPVNNGCISQGPNNTADGSSHRGVEAVDIAATSGTPVTVTHDGFIIFSYFGDTDDSGSLNMDPNYGNNVKVSGVINGRNIVTVYGHLSSVNEGRRVNGETFVIASGVSVSAGDIIGYVDHTGRSSGTHLHYELQGGLPIQVIFPFGNDSCAQ